MSFDITSAINIAVNAANRQADINERKVQFTQNTVLDLANRGYNAVIVSSGWRAQGHQWVDTRSFEGTIYTIIVGRRDQTMTVEHQGGGGFVNWALRGTNWVRWGNIVKFHPHWNYATMGTPYEVRPVGDFPGW